MNRELTTRELEVAAKLKAAWSEKKMQNKDLNQEKLAEKLDMTQGAVSHYLNGKRPLGLEALMKFCTVLGLDVMDTYPEIFAKHGVQDIAQATEFVSLFLQADNGVKQGVLSILRSSISQE